MEKDWKTYCLMSSIAYIEEMSKPTEHLQIKKYKDKIYKCLCFHSIRLKMNDLEVVQKFFDITKKWEKKRKILLIGKTFNGPRKENSSGQYLIYFSPVWINHVLSKCGKIPNKYSLKTAIKRIDHLKQYKKISINLRKNLFNSLLKNKKLSAGAFVVSLDLEFRGTHGGRPSLCMSEKYMDFLEFMLRVAKKWKWTNNKKLSPVNIENSIKLGINASPQYEFRININGLKEIYRLAGPLANRHKDKSIKFNVNRSRNYVNLGGGHRKNKSKEKILEELKRKKDSRTTDLQFIVGVGTDVVLNHLHELERLGKITKERKGKRYIWNIK